MNRKPKPKIDNEIQSLLQPLTSEEKEALRADVEVNGVLQAIVLDEEGTILDGHHRFAIDPKCRTIVKRGLSRGEKLAYTIRANLTRRNLTQSQKQELKVKQKEIAKKLSEENRTQTEIAQLLGVTQQAVSKWFTPNTTSCNKRNDKPHSNTKVNASGRKEALERSEAGESQQQIAADLGVSQQQASKIIAQEKKKEQKKKQLEKAAEEAKKNAKRSKVKWTVIEGDCLEVLQQYASGKAPFGSDWDWAKCIIADPPYNESLEYGNGHNDSLSDRQYLKWVEQWVSLCFDCVGNEGALWLVISDTYAHHYRLIGERAGWQFQNWVIWHETFGVQRELKFARNHRHLLHFTAGQPFWNADAARVPSARQTKYNDPRANPDGKVMGNVWDDIPRLTGNAKERLPGMTQLPEKLVSRMIEITCPAGGLVIDPFSGSGTTGKVSVESARPFIGIEQNAERAELSRGRIGV